MRAMYRCLIALLVISISLFLGLFFGLNYPGSSQCPTYITLVTLINIEIVRHGWPRTRCTVLSSEIVTRYCCETSCEDETCRNAPAGSPQCSSTISTLDNGYSPSVCATNSSACPPGIGSVCDGGSVHGANHLVQV